MYEARGQKLAVIAVAIFAIAWTVLLVTGPIDWDLGWQMYVARRMLHGARLYIDIGATEQHPPLYTWMCASMAAIANALRIDPVRFFLGVTSGLCLASGAYASRIARGACRGESNAVTLAAFMCAALAMYGFAGGSGEQIAVAFALPYIVAAAVAWRRGAYGGRRESIAIGLLAGFGLAMKPHYALVWLATELALAMRRRSARSFLRATSVTMVAVWAVYIVATVLLTPAYIRAAEEAALYYNAFMPGSVMSVVTKTATIYVFIAALVVWHAIRRGGESLVNREDATGDVALFLFIGAVAMWVGAIVQMKGWPHHMLPATALSVAAIAAGVVAARPSRAIIVIVVLLLFGSYRIRHERLLLRDAQIGAPTFLPGMTEVVHRFAGERPVLMLAYGLSAGFPLINETRAEWTLPESSLWMVSGLYADEWKTGGPYAYRSAGEWVPFERKLHDLIWRGIQERPPAVVIIQSQLESRFDLRRFVEADPRMKAYLRNWTKVGTVGPYDVLLPTQVRTARRLNRPGLAATFVASGW